MAPAGHADHGNRPQQAAAQPCLAQEGRQHGRGRFQVRDHPVAQRVEDIDTLGGLTGQGVRPATDRNSLPGPPVHGDRGGFLDDEPSAADAHQGVDGTEIDRHACPQPHHACLF